MLLRDLPILVLDVQTTGATPALGRVLELGLGIGDEASSFILQGVEDERIARRILALTGIAPEELAAGISEVEAFAKLRLATESLATPVAVAHVSTFESRFLDVFWEKHAGAPAPWLWLCTHQIARRLHPNMPSRSLRALAGFYGFRIGMERRALHHVEATTRLWLALVEDLEQTAGIATLDALRAWLAIKAPPRGRQRIFMMDRAARLALPAAPGVYRFLARDGAVLYVGKATSLRDRVNSYFRNRKGHGAAKNELLAQVKDVDVTPCATPLEAALLECDEIKRLDPPYNVLLRAGARRVGYFDRDLVPTLDDAPFGAAHFGPFPSPYALLPLTWLAGACAGAATELSSLLRNTVGPVRILPAAVVGGLSDTAVRFDLPHDASPRDWLARAIVAARKEAVHAAEVDLATQEDEILAPDARDDDRELSAEELAESLGEMVVGVGRAYLRSRRVKRLLQSTITFDGRLLHEARHDLASRPVDIAAYDRVRVLATELDRLGRRPELVISWIDVAARTSC